MKLSEYIKEIQHLIQVDGDIETERLIMDNENLSYCIKWSML